MPGVPSLIIKFTFPLSFSFFWRLSHPSVVLYYLLSNQIELIPCCSQHIVVVDSWCRATCYCTNISWLSWPHPSPQNETRWNKPLETTNKEQICLPTDKIKKKKKNLYAFIIQQNINKIPPFFFYLQMKSNTQSTCTMVTRNCTRCSHPFHVFFNINIYISLVSN